MYEAETVSCKRSLIAVGSVPVQKILVCYGQGQSLSFDSGQVPTGSNWPWHMTWCVFCRGIMRIQNWHQL